MADEVFDLPEITWKIIREHLFERLHLDEEWVVEGDSYLRWQPGLFPLTVQVLQTGEVPDGSGYVWRRVNARTVILETSEEEGAELGARFGDLYPFGSIFWDEGYLVASTSIMLNNRSADMLRVLETAILGQATAVVVLANSLLDDASDDDRTVLESTLQIGDPELGARDALDGMLGFYRLPREDSIDEQLLAGGSALVNLWTDTRDVYEEIMAANWTRGFANDEVVFFQASNGLAIGVGPVDDDEDAEIYGPGLSVLCIVAAIAEDFGPSFLNEVSAAMALRGGSHLCRAVVTKSVGDAFSLSVRTFIPAGAIGPKSSHDLAVTVSNIVGHVASGARALVPQEET